LPPPASGRSAQRQPAFGGQHGVEAGHEAAAGHRPQVHVRLLRQRTRPLQQVRALAVTDQHQAHGRQRPAGPGVVVPGTLGGVRLQPGTVQLARVAHHHRRLAGDDGEVGHLAVDVAVGLDQRTAADAAAGHHHAVRSDEA
jgi:hypothetical protein